MYNKMCQRSTVIVLVACSMFSVPASLSINTNFSDYVRNVTGNGTYIKDTDINTIFINNSFTESGEKTTKFKPFVTLSTLINENFTDSESDATLIKYTTDHSTNVADNDTLFSKNTPDYSTKGMDFDKLFSTNTPGYTTNITDFGTLFSKNTSGYSTNVTGFGTRFSKNTSGYTTNVMDFGTLFSKNTPGYITNETDFNTHFRKYTTGYITNITHFEPGFGKRTTENPMHMEGDAIWKILNKTIVHDDLEMSLILFVHTLHCGLEATCDLQLPNVTIPSTFAECGPCSCNETCLSNQGQSCCPDVYPRLEPPEIEPSLTQCEPVIFPISIYTPFSRMQPRLLINKCPYHSTIYLAQRCRQDYWALWHEGLHANAIPVTDKLNQSKHYKNVYCALCHGLQKPGLLFWKIQFISNSVVYPSFEKHGSYSFLEDLFFLLQEHRDYMFLQFQPPANVSYESLRCYINSCNITGLWLFYDDIEDRGCRLYTHGYDNNFANVFCFLCNGIMLGAFSPDLPYDVLIDVNDLETFKAMQVHSPAAKYTCPSGYIFDELYKTCRQLWCSYMFVPVGRECLTAINHIHGYTIAKGLSFTLTTPKPLIRDVIASLNRSFIKRTEAILLEIKATLGLDIEIAAHEYLYNANVSYFRTEQSEIVIHNVEFQYFSLILHLRFLKQQKHVNLKDAIDALDTMQQCENYPGFMDIQMSCTIDFLSIIIKENSVEIEKLFEVYGIDWNQTQLRNGNRSISDSYEMFSMMTVIKDPFSVSAIESNKLLLTENYTCLRLLFHENEYVPEAKGLHFPWINITLPYKYIVGQFDTGAAGICVETYEALIRDISDSRKQNHSTANIATGFRDYGIYATLLLTSFIFPFLISW